MEQKEQKKIECVRATRETNRSQHRNTLIVTNRDSQEKM